MFSTVYISNTKLQVVTGEFSDSKGSVKKLRSFDLPEDLIANGSVSNTEAFNDYIKKLWKENSLPKKKICLVINSTHFTNKTFEMPMLNDKKTMTYLPREFSDVERAQDPVYSCFTLRVNNKTKLRKCWGTMAERSFINSFVSAFILAGCSISSVEGSSGVTIRLISQLPCIRRSTALVQHIDDGFLSSYLYVNGVYTYSSRSRLFNPLGSVGFGIEVARSVSNIIQFAKAQNIEQTLQTVYLAGVNGDDYTICEDSIYQMDSELSVERLNAAKFIKFPRKIRDKVDFSDFVTAIAGLKYNTGKLSLYEQFLRNKMAEQASKSRAKAVVPVVLLALVLVSLIGYIIYNNYKLSGQLDEINEYLSSDTVVQSVAEYDENEALSKQVNTYLLAIDSVQEAIDSYPIMNSEVIAVLFADALGYAEITINSYNSSNGMLGFTATAPEVELVNQYISVLRNEKILTEVSYTGYSYDDSAGMWNISVSCCLSEIAGRPPVEEAETEDNQT